MMGKRRASIEEPSNVATDYSRKADQGWCFDQECRRIRMSRTECKPFSCALEALKSDKNSHTHRVRISFSEIRRRLKHKKNRSIFNDDCIHHGVDATTPSTSATNTASTKEARSDQWEREARRKKIDVPERDAVDAILAANRVACNRFIMGISPPEHEFWPRKDGKICSTLERINPLRMKTGTESPQFLSTDDEAQDEMKIAKAPNDDHSTLHSVSDNDFPSRIINGFNVPESNKSTEEHESPVSVLDQFLAQDHFHESSSTIIYQISKRSLKPRRLCFDESSDEQDYSLSQYAHLVFRASSLNWAQISTIRPLSEELLHSCLYDEVESLFSGPHLDTRLLFDRMNEVLLQIQRSPATERRRINHRLALEEAVVDEIEREAEFYQTQERTLDQIVAKDVADRRLWLDLLCESEHDIIMHIAQHILEEAIVGVILDMHC